MSNLTHHTSRSGLGAAHVPLDLSTKWQGAVVIKLKTHRALALSGTVPFQLNDFEVPQATGIIELIGGRTGSAATSMLVGFTGCEHRPLPTFTLQGDQALGTLVLPGHYFATWLEVAKSSAAHFRIGGDGRWNALASDAAFLQLTG